MSALRRDIPAIAPTVNVLLMLWVLVGRGLFVPLGWLTLFGVLASPVVALCLWSTTRMMRRRSDPELTPAQTRLQLVLWFAMLGFGLTASDGGDSGATSSVLTHLLGGAHEVAAVSDWFAFGCLVTGVVAWIVLSSKLSADLVAQARVRSVDPPD